jgi:hypothetical protein
MYMYFTGVDALKLAEHKSSDVADKFCSGILSYVSDFPLSVSSITPLLCRIILEKDSGSGKAVPISLHRLSADLTLIPNDPRLQFMTTS